MELKADAGNISKGLAPAGAVQSVTDFGQAGYGGPCPPPGPIHEYLITVYALKTKLNLDKNTGAPLVGFNINANTIAKASIVMYAQQ
jgi:Raf kinase inhibitor-like YbhB/YbcL family protein